MEEERIVMMSTKGYQELVGSQDGKNIYWTTDIDVELPIKMKQSGPGSEAPISVPDQFRNTAKKQGDKPAFFFEKQGKVIRVSWNEYLRDVDLFGKAMHVIGV